MSTVKNPTFTFGWFLSNRVYFLSNNVGIHFLFTYHFPIRSVRLVPMLSGNTPKSNANLFLYPFRCLIYIPISISSQKNYIRYMAVQYLKELMSIYKGTSMKLLLNKSDFSAIEFRLWNNMTMAFYLNILQIWSWFSTQ